MAEYINKNAAYDYATLDSWYIASVTNGTPVWTEEHLEELLNDFYVIPKDTPTADVVEVKHGRWTKLHISGATYGKVYYQHKNCSVNETELHNQPYDYCPNCGAKMDEKETE